MEGVYKRKDKYFKKFLTKWWCYFISIDDNEVATIRGICDELFGKKNFLGTFITRQAQRSNAKHINTTHEYVIAYAKNKNMLSAFQVKRIDIPEQNTMITSIYNEVSEIIKNSSVNDANREIKKIITKYCNNYNISWLKNYSNVDENGRIYFAVDLSMPGKPRTVDIPEIDLYLEPLKSRGWSSDKKFIELYNNDVGLSIIAHEVVRWISPACYNIDLDNQSG